MPYFHDEPYPERVRDGVSQLRCDDHGKPLIEMTEGSPSKGGDPSVQGNLYLALIHYPVCNKRGKTIASALTSIDMHDIARAAMTFGVSGFFVVTPLLDQQVLAHEVIDHWVAGIGGQLNPHRKRALELIRVVDTFEDALHEVRNERQKEIVTVATSATRYERAVGIDALARNLQNDASHIVCFGTAWGMTREFMESADVILEPVYGHGDYNHLSVRSAVSIILDRLVRSMA